MSRCAARKVSEVTGKTVLECYLTSSHETVMKEHYDSKEHVKWTHANVNPVPLENTRTQPKNKTAKSVAAHTGVFEVIHD